MNRRARSGLVAIGVDVGGTNVRAARVGPDGVLSDMARVRTGARSVASLVTDLCGSLLDDAVVGIGIGVPGRLDAERTTVISAGFVDLAGVRLGDVVGAALGLPVVLDNDAAMALRAELALGAAVDARDVALFTVGTGVGGAVAIGGRIERGRANAGQLGHLGLDPAGPRCNCGRTGCIEVLASGTALRRLVAEAGLPAATTIDDLLEGATRGGAAAGVLQRWARAWRHAIDTVVAALDPELVLLGGGLGRAAAAAVETYAPATSPWFACPVLPAALGDEAGVVGAGLHALDVRT